MVLRESPFGKAPPSHFSLLRVWYKNALETMLDWWTSDPSSLTIYLVSFSSNGSHSDEQKYSGQRLYWSCQEGGREGLRPILLAYY